MEKYITVNGIVADLLNGTRQGENVLEFRKLNNGNFAAPLSVLEIFELDGNDYEIADLNNTDFYVPQYNDIRK